MQRLDERKRKDIIAAAIGLFSERPFHEVRLDDVAAAARVGKGTVYLYFESKEDLYQSLILEGMDELVERVRARVAETERSAWEVVEGIVGELVTFGFERPHVFQLIRAHGNPTNDCKMQERRRELSRLVGGALARGVERGEIEDLHPELTAEYILGFVRSVVLHGPKDVQPEVLKAHFVSVIGGGIRIGDVSHRTPAGFGRRELA